jgi:hypothetical protein
MLAVSRINPTHRGENTLKTFKGFCGFVANTVAVLIIGGSFGLVAAFALVISVRGGDIANFPARLIGVAVLAVQFLVVCFIAYGVREEE